MTKTYWDEHSIEENNGGREHMVWYFIPGKEMETYNYGTYQMQDNYFENVWNHTEKTEWILIGNLIYRDVYSTYQTIIGTDENDIIYGNGALAADHGPHFTYRADAFEEKIYGGGGNDIIYGGEGNDRIEGGSGNDILHGGDGADSLVGGTGNDWLYTGSLQDNKGDNLTGGSGHDTFVIGEVQAPIHEEFNWGAAAGEIVLDTIDSLSEVAGGGLEVLNSFRLLVTDIVEKFLTAGNDTITPALSASFVEITDFDPTRDVIVFPLNDGAKQGIFWSDSNMIGDFSFTQNLEQQDNKILSVIIGDLAEELGLGSNLSAAEKNAFIEALKQNAIFINSEGAFYGADFNRPVEDLDPGFMEQLGDSSFIVIGAHGGFVVEGTGSDDLIMGTQYGDVLFGYSPDQYVAEDDGNDHLYGFDGDDVFRAGGGNNQLFGGEGSDTASYFGANVGITVDMSQKHVDTLGREYIENANGHEWSFKVNGEEEYTTFEGVDNLYDIENIAGTIFDDDIRGDTQDNVLMGEAGNDYLFGNAGNDVLVSGEGDDSLEGGNGADVFVLTGGNNTIIDFDGDSDGIAVDYQAYGVSNRTELSYNIEEGGIGYLRVTSTGVVIATFEGSGAGSFDMDTHFRGEIHGDAQDNVLTGDAGNDYLSGHDGNDILDGGDGNDALEGGDGSDLFVLNGGNNTIVDFEADSDSIEIDYEAYGISDRTELSYKIEEGGIGYLRVASTGVVIATVLGPDASSFDMDTHIVNNVFADPDGWQDFSGSQWSDSLNTMSASGLNITTGTGQDEVYFNGGTDHFVLDLNIGDGDYINIEADAYGITSLNDLSIEQFGSNRFGIRLPEGEFLAIVLIEGDTVDLNGFIASLALDGERFNVQNNIAQMNLEEENFVPEQAAEDPSSSKEDDDPSEGEIDQLFERIFNSGFRENAPSSDYDEDYDLYKEQDRQNRQEAEDYGVAYQETENNLDLAFADPF